MNFKKTLIAAAAVALSASAMASNLSILAAGSPTSFVVATNTWGAFGITSDAYTNAFLTGFTSDNGTVHAYDTNAQLHLNGPSAVTFQFLGKEAAYNNIFYSYDGISYNALFSNSSTPVSTISSVLNVTSASNLMFAFKSNNAGPLITNPSFQIGLMRNAAGNQALALFNDAYADKDFDDMAIKISVTAVPEPETYAMLLAGLGLMGTIARRRNKSKSV